MLEPGQIIGNYQIVETIGEGGFALVFRLEHTVLGSQHALKVLRPELVADRSIRHRFLSEARVTANLRHPNIIRATDAIAVPGVAGIVMDYVEGGSLEGLIAGAQEPPAPSLVRSILVPILDALDYAHARGVIHRDIKPANILIEHLPDGRIRPMLVDFGVARVRGELSARQEHTQVGTRIGTVGYMSPEQLESATEADQRSDLFSLAATIFELATLAPPFQGKNSVAVIRAISSGHFTVPDALIHSDPVLASVLERALQHQPEDRFASSRQMAEALSQGIAQPPPVMSPSEPPPIEPPPIEPPPVEPPPIEPPRFTPPPRKSPISARPHPPPPPNVDLLVRSTDAPAGARLLYQPDTDKEQEILLPESDFTIGRSQDCHLCLPTDAWVSRRHCRLYLEDGAWYIRDHGTANGTVVNGTLVLKRQLFGGETIEIGQTLFRFELVR